LSRTRVDRAVNILNDLEWAIAQHIHSSPQQRIPFAEFMALALYHPQGYYANSSRIIGFEGDFVTSPHMGHDFGELLAVQFADMWQALDQPKPFTLMEMGAGQGLVAADVLGYLQSHYPECFDCLRYIVVEKSAALKAEQQQRLGHWLMQGVSLVWQDLANVPSQSIVGCAFSNELVDAFPVHWVELRDQTLQEMWVTVKGQDFVPTLGELSTPQLQTYFEQVGIDLSQEYPEGYRTEVNLAALDWLAQVKDRMQRGYVLTIDYGYPANRYYSAARQEGTLQCYYQHGHHNDPFIHVGEQDITAHVDFTALERRGEALGLQTLGFTQQGLFLMALGLGSRLSQLGQVSSAIATAKDIQAVMHRRDALQQLISPMGLGNFGVLIQSSGLTPKEIARPLKGLTIPAMH
jgi:SAM-dependent MidA family methyltransferase